MKLSGTGGAVVDKMAMECFAQELANGLDDPVDNGPYATLARAG